MHAFADTALAGEQCGIVLQSYAVRRFVVEESTVPQAIHHDTV